jgi:HlyD family secretion protein
MKFSTVLLAAAVFGLLGWLTIGALGPQEVEATVETHPVARRGFKVTVREKGELQAARSIDVVCELEGRSTILFLIGEGTEVKEGDLLVELASDELEEKLQSQRIEVNSAQAALKSAEEQFEILVDQNKSNCGKASLKLELAQLDFTKYEEGDWPQQLQDARLRLEEAEKVLDRLTRELKNSVTLRDKEYISQTDYEKAEFDAYKAGIEFKKAERDLQLLQDNTRIKDLKQRESDREEAKKELDRAIKEAGAKEREQSARLEASKQELLLKEQRLHKYEEQLKKTRIIAPAPGLVVYGSTDMRGFSEGDQIKEGAQVRERQVILRLPDTSTMKVVVRVHEAQTSKIALDQPAKIEVEGLTDRVFSGKITKIAPLADSRDRWMNPELKQYETEIVLEQGDPLLKPGATAHAEILVGELTDVVAVPIQSVYRRGARSFVFVGGSGTSGAATEVELGMASDDFVEIKSGLNEGQRVLLAVSDDLKRELPQVPPEAEVVMPQPGEGMAQQAPAGGAGRPAGQPAAGGPQPGQGQTAQGAGEAGKGPKGPRPEGQRPEGQRPGGARREGRSRG